VKKLNRREVMEGAAASVAAAVLPESPVVAAATAPLMRRQPLGSGREIGRWVTYPGTSLAPDYLFMALGDCRAACPSQSRR